MSMSDPIADLLTRIRNASRAEHEKVDIPSSKLKVRLAEILKDEGFIKNYRLIEDKKQGMLRVYLSTGGEREDHLGASCGCRSPGGGVRGQGQDPTILAHGVVILSTSRGDDGPRLCESRSWRGSPRLRV